MVSVLSVNIKVNGELMNGIGSFCEIVNFLQKQRVVGNFDLRLKEMQQIQKIKCKLMIDTLD